MVELLKDYDIGEIISILVTFAIGLKGFIVFWDWAVDRIKKAFNQQTQKEKEKAFVEEKIKFNRQELDRLERKQKEMLGRLDYLAEKVDILVQSDKDSIKAFITKEHHYYCYEKKWIDDYSLDCIERRFGHYVKEGGNSFIEELMEEIRGLPKVAPCERKEME